MNGDCEVNCYRNMTFCASPGCKNVCGRKMSSEDESRLKGLNKMNGTQIPVAYAYFCDLPAEIYHSIKENEAPE